MKMKKLFLIVICLLFTATNAYAAVGTTTVTRTTQGWGFQTVTIVCTGGTAGDTGTVPDTTIDVWDSMNKNALYGWYLYKVEAFPTSGGTAPDAGSVFVLDSDSLDLLGSEDGGTTAYAGLNLIHATLKRGTIPNLYIPRGGVHVDYYPMITGPLTLKVADQITSAADWTIVLTFVK